MKKLISIILVLVTVLALCAFGIGLTGNHAGGHLVACRAKDYRVYGQKLGQYMVDTPPTLAEVGGSGIKLSEKTLTLPTKEACTDFKSYEYCVTNFAVGTGEQMIDEFVKMLTEMKGA